MHERADGRDLWRLFLVFLRLGVTSFGGPIAHIGYFRAEFVTRRGWLDDHRFADLLALCQFLPGPASSQMNLAIAYGRGGWAGALLGFAGFTLPSALALAMLAAAWGSAAPDTGWLAGGVAGLKLVAVAVVAHAVTGMARNLTPDAGRAMLALLALFITALFPVAWAQIAAIATGAILATVFGLGPDTADTDGADKTGLTAPSPLTGTICLVLFAMLLTAALWAESVTSGGSVVTQIAAVFYRSGALVFGGGHVVLPLLESGTVTTGLVPADSFLAGYGAAQAVPGPLFTFAAWLGQVAAGWAGAVLALTAIFLPGFLLLMGVLPFWRPLSRHIRARRAMAGANAAVVGILGVALYDPVFTSGVGGPLGFALAAALFAMLVLWQRPAWQVVLAGMGAGVFLGGMGLL